MYILSIDTSTEFASVALLKNGTVLNEFNDSGKFAHNQKLFDMITEILKKENIGIKDIDLFAVGSGPGSFTGLRVGMSAIKGMAIGSGKKIVPVNSMDAVAFKGLSIYNEVKELNVILEGKQKDFFFSRYKRNGEEVKKINQISVHPYEEYCYIKGVTVGNVKDDIITSSEYKSGYYPEAGIIGKLALIRIEQADDKMDFEPEYYKNFKINKPGKNGNF